MSSQGTAIDDRLAVVLQQPVSGSNVGFTTSQRCVRSCYLLGQPRFLMSVVPFMCNRLFCSR